MLQPEEILEIYRKKAKFGAGAPQKVQDSVNFWNKLAPRMNNKAADR